MAQFHIGGSFAPPLTDEKLAAYRLLAESAPADVSGAMQKLIKMAEVFRETPDSSEPGRPHQSGFGVIVPLHAQEIERIWDHVPWDDEQPGHHVNECNVYAQLFEGISQVTSKQLRDAAFHLLWYAKELAHDREPITTDKL